MASSTFSLTAMFVVLWYGIVFQPWQQDVWIKGSLVGLGVVLVLLEFFRIVMITLVELRMFENRRKAKAGHFLPRRVRRAGDKEFQAPPPPAPWKRAVAAPSMPQGRQVAPLPAMPAVPPPRPAFLPKTDGPPALPPPRGRPPGTPQGALPVAPGPPAFMQFSSAALGMAASQYDPPPAPSVPRIGVPGRSMPGSVSPGPGTPKSVFSATGRLGQTGSGLTPTGARSPAAPGTPMGSARGRPGGPGGTPMGSARGAPKMSSAADMWQGGGMQAPPSPAHSTHSLSSLAQSLNQQVKAGRHPTPPPPPSQPGSVPAAGSSPAPPPAPSAPPPNYSRPPSRPTSATSAQAKPKSRPSQGP